METLKIGDTLVESGRSGLSKAIQLAERSRWNHLSSYIGEGKVTEALAQGYVLMDLNNSIGKAKHVLIKRPTFDFDEELFVKTAYEMLGLKYDYLTILLWQPIWQVTEFLFNKPLWLGGRGTHPKRTVVCSSAAPYLYNVATGGKMYPDWYLIDPQDFADNFKDFQTIQLK